MTLTVLGTELTDENYQLLLRRVSTAQQTADNDDSNAVNEYQIVVCTRKIRKPITLTSLGVGKATANESSPQAQLHQQAMQALAAHLSSDRRENVCLFRLPIASLKPFTDD